MSQVEEPPLHSRLQGLIKALEQLSHKAEHDTWSQSSHLKTQLYMERLLLPAGDPALTARAMALFDQCQDLRERIDSLLEDAAVWEEGKPPALVDVQGLLDTMLRLTRVERERTARLEQDFESPLPEVLIDKSMLARVLFTLIINAVGLMQSAPSREHVLGVRTRRDEGQVLITLSTTGPAIPSELLSRLFDPLCPALVPGSGQWMGLSISQDCLRRMGGELRVERPPEGGMRFCVLLPVGGRLPEENGAWWRGLPALIRGEEQRFRALQDDLRNIQRARSACFLQELRSLAVPLCSSVKQLTDSLAELNRQKEEPSPSVDHRNRSLIMTARALRLQNRDLRHVRCRPPEMHRSVDVHACLVEALRLCQGKLLARSARLETNFAPRPPRVLGNAKNLRSVFLRLIRTCLWIMPGRHPSGSYEKVLRVRTVPDGQWVRVTFSFPSYILEPEVRAWLLESGYTSGAREKNGPPICLALTQAMGGELQFDAEEGTGMSYSMLLPVDPADGRELRVSPAAASPRPASIAALEAALSTHSLDTWLAALPGDVARLRTRRALELDRLLWTEHPASLASCLLARTLGLPVLAELREAWMQELDARGLPWVRPLRALPVASERLASPSEGSGFPSCFDPSGTRLLSGRWLFDGRTGELIAELTPTDDQDREGGPAAPWLHLGERILLFMHSGLCAWDTRSGAPLRVQEALHFPGRCAFACDRAGSRLAVLQRGTKRVELQALPDGRRLATLDFDLAGTDLAMSADGARIAVRHQRNLEVRAADGTLLQRLVHAYSQRDGEEPERQADTLRFSRDGRRLASCPDDKGWWIWNLQNGAGRVLDKRAEIEAFAGFAAPRPRDWLLEEGIWTLFVHWPTGTRIALPTMGPWVCNPAEPRYLACDELHVELRAR